MLGTFFQGTNLSYVLEPLKSDAPTHVPSTMNLHPRAFVLQEKTKLAAMPQRP